MKKAIILLIVLISSTLYAQVDSLATPEDSIFVAAKNFFIFILTIFLIWFIYRKIKKTARNRSNSANQKNAIEAGYDKWPFFSIKGINVDTNSQLRECWVPGKLVAQTKNKYDKYAIEVVANIHLGWVPKGNSELHKILLERYNGEMDTAIEITKEDESGKQFWWGKAHIDVTDFKDKEVRSFIDLNF